MNVIFGDLSSSIVGELQKERRCGCEVNHLSQRRYDCLMITEEGWITYGLEAVEHVLQQGILWKQKLFASCNSLLTTMHTTLSKTLK